MANVDVTRIASNVGALNALNSLQTINAKLAMHQTRLSTGKRINSAADDPAGMTIATKMMARSEGLKVALNNIGDANNMLSVAESGLSKMNDILMQMRGKAEAAASDTLGSTERAAIQTQLSAFAAQIDSIVGETKWNGVKLLDGTANKQFQTGTESDENITWQLGQNHDASSTTGLQISTQVLSLSSQVINQSQSSASFTTTSPTAVGSTLNSASALTTGGYSVKIEEVGGIGNTIGWAAKTSTSYLAGVNGITTAATTTTGNQLVSGTYTLRIDAANATTAKYTILGPDNSTIMQTSSAGLDLNGNAGALTDATGVGIGIKLTLGSGTAGLVAGSTMSFEFVRADDVKYSLKDASGVNVAVDVNGAAGVTASSGQNATGNYGYATMGATAVNTGRGLTFGLKATGVVKGDSINFDYRALGNNVVDVSSSSKAATYMNTVSSAMDVVSNSMANLGSLMARLTFKEEQVATAQVNVEGAYSRIMNANMAEEQMNASKYTILQQTAVAMLAQANQAPQSLLSLFR